ncbi:hypothetical protein QBC47DRAFT_94298 [Echria macrotheca]|uniref:Uncharacterized protein n=1 Tax=Echria macrotheca TaxID=438768 RepID=A0AAJ0B3X9_9PEZI|nr:hypothetical protein QBC47DRAFT_94298 [Echria macrotheca]
MRSCWLSVPAPFFVLILPDSRVYQPSRGPCFNTAATLGWAAAPDLGMPGPAGGKRLSQSGGRMSSNRRSGRFVSRRRSTGLSGLVVVVHVTVAVGLSSAFPNVPVADPVAPGPHRGELALPQSGCYAAGTRSWVLEDCVTMCPVSYRSPTPEPIASLFVVDAEPALVSHLCKTSSLKVGISLCGRRRSPGKSSLVRVFVSAMALPYVQWHLVGPTMILRVI